MDNLITFFNEHELTIILKENPDINILTDDEIKEMIDILISLNCSNENIHDIIIANPFYLSRMAEDIKNLIKKLRNLRLENLEDVFSNQPWFLNKDDYEIDVYIEENLKKGFALEDIVDNMLIELANS